MTETSFGGWVKRRRRSLDLTQEELARRVGCSMSAIFKIEADERRPSRQIAELLAEHLQIAPDQRELFLKIARQAKAVGSLDAIAPPAEFTPAPPSNLPGGGLPVGGLPGGNLPLYPNPFIGRDYEIDMVVRQLLDPGCRMLTLTGPGGVGKTRLAVEVARRLANRFAHGAAFLSLAGVSQPESIIPAVAEALGTVFSGPADPQVQVVNDLRRKEILLLFDNMEELVEGSGLLGDILQQAPGVKLLLTSREQMHLQWEWVFEVQGLPVPDEASTGALETKSAAALFLQRARQAAHDLELTPAEAGAVARICRLVDGLPLAIELAAAWARVMSIGDIARELEHGPDLLAATYHDVPARHRSMRLVFDHSWKLLTAEEQAALMKLSVFPGGFTREAAAETAGASLPLLAALVNKSLLRYNKKTGRYDFHELVRQYACAKLREQPGAEPQAQEQHSLYYSRWIAALEAPLKSAGQAQTAAQIRLETANWLAAWHWAVLESRIDLLRAMTPCLYWYYEIHGAYTEALSAYHTAVDALRAAGAPKSLYSREEQFTFAFLVNQLGWFEFRMGSLDPALKLFNESLELAHKYMDVDLREDQEALYHIHVNWGYLALVRNDTAQAKAMTEASLEFARKLNSPWHIAISETILGIVEFQNGSAGEAYRQLANSLENWRAVGDPRGQIFCMLYLSSTALALGEHEQAEATLLESSAIAQAKMDRWAQAFSLELLGQAAMAQGRPETARERFQHSLTLSQEIGDRLAEAQTLIHLVEARAAVEWTGITRNQFAMAYLRAQQARWPAMIVEVLAAYITLDPALDPQTKLAAARSILAHPFAALPVRRRVERLCAELSASLPAGQIETAQAEEKNAEAWAQELLGGR